MLVVVVVLDRLYWVLGRAVDVGETRMRKMSTPVPVLRRMEPK